MVEMLLGCDDHDDYHCILEEDTAEALEDEETVLEEEQRTGQEQEVEAGDDLTPRVTHVLVLSWS